MNSQILTYIAGAGALISVVVICVHNIAQAIHALARAIVSAAEALAKAAPNSRLSAVSQVVETDALKVDGLVTTIDNAAGALGAIAGATK